MTDRQQDQIDRLSAKVQRLLALAALFWDWFDKRDIEKHLIAVSTLLVTYMVIKWSMHYAEMNVARSGTDIAAVLAAINVPIATLQGAVIKWYFNARTTGTDPSS